MRQRPIGRRMTASALAAALVATAAHAHHSPAGFDMTSQITVSGVVTRYDWANPHVYIYLESRAADADRQVWEIEGAAPSMMRRRGWTADSIAVGDAITVAGNPGRSGQPIMRLMALTKNDGVELSNRANEFAAPAEDIAPAAGLAGIWVADGSGPAWDLFTNPRFLPLTPSGLEAALGYDESRDSNHLDCIPFSIPMMMLLPDIKSIEIEADAVLIRGEFDGAVRTVHMDVASHAGAAPSYLGHSIGRWADDTLVIDTAAYLPHPQGLATALASSAQKHTVERLRPDPGGASFTYSVVVEDPQQLEEPVSGEMTYHYRPDLDYAQIDCNLESARRFLSYGTQ